VKRIVRLIFRVRVDNDRSPNIGGPPIKGIPQFVARLGFPGQAVSKAIVPLVRPFPAAGGAVRLVGCGAMDAPRAVGIAIEKSKISVRIFISYTLREN
jgi:hypothetical protein